MDYKIEPMTIKGVALDVEDLFMVHMHYQREMLSEYIVDNVLVEYDESKKLPLHRFVGVVLELMSDGYDEQEAIEEAKVIYQKQANAFTEPLKFKQAI